MNSQLYRLLLVEDSLAEIRLIEEAIKEAQLNESVIIEAIQNPENVMDHLSGARLDNQLPDLILLDLNMPRMHGLEILRMVKAEDQIREIPVYILTNSDNKMDMADCYQAKADGYVQKPTDFHQFVAFFNALRTSIELKNKISILYLDKFYQENLRMAM
jgi:CheY-like chemotaxis protein